MAVRNTERRAQRGIAIFTVLVMLVAISLVGVVVINMGGLEQKMSGNMQLLQESFEATEGGVSGTISLNGQADDPFDGPAATYPASLVAVSPIQEMNAQLGVSASVDLVAVAQTCPRSETATDEIHSACDFYHVDAAQAETNAGVSYAVTQHVVDEVSTH